MNLFLISMKMCEGIEIKMNAFWWNNRCTGNGIKWISWEKMCEVKEEGG